uniref:Uncharacterized protein n=1 Tax=Magallana gigas TaxID=29159 RepID=K1QWQ9_MAGGI
MPGCKQCCYSTGTMQGRRGMVCFRTADRYMFVPSVARQNVYNFLRTCPGFAIDFEWPLGFYVYADASQFITVRGTNIERLESGHLKYAASRDLHLGDLNTILKAV